MSSNVQVPALGESISEAVLLQWLKNEGDQVAIDEPICELESDKATVDLPAPVAGVLRQKIEAGATVQIGDVVAQIDPAAARSASATSEAPRAKRSAERAAAQENGPTTLPGALEKKPAKPEKAAAPPSTRRAAEPEPEPQPEPEPERKPSPKIERPAKPPAAEPPAEADGVRRETMSKIRRSIADRMVRAQQAMAMLTTFNEIDMTAVQALRKRHQEQFKEAHGVSLGLMSFFAHATALALKQFPVLNAQLDGDDILYHDYVHLSVAVSTERGLVVPVIRNVESMSFARIETEIKRAAAAARDGKLSIQELSGGTFTITNGGVFGSLLSTPILNPPQTGILGLHTIQERPVAIEGQVQVRPMMYVALTYDHRLADGKDAVTFLVRIKQLLEDPIQMILEI